MLFLPYSTDAPIYHWPITTGSLILVNIAVFFATTWQVMTGSMEVEQVEWLILQFDRINPFQWFSAAFMHMDHMHLLSNMFFLWVFGIIVEGKIGSLPFLALYMLITGVDGAATQIPMFLMDGQEGALGASGTIFGVMMIALIWAPENCIDVFWWVFFRFGTFEARIITFAGTFLFLQLVSLYINGFVMSSAMLHMTGALIGAPMGLYMLNRRWVDCENWDLIARNEWLHDIRWLCPADRIAEFRRDEEDDDDPVAAALAMPHSMRVKRKNSNGQRKPTVDDQIDSPKNADHGTKTKTSSPVSASQAVVGKRLLGEQASAAETSLPPHSDRMAACRKHPEYNRLSFQLRQAIEQGNLATAQHQYDRMTHIKLVDGLADSTLMNYTRLLLKAKSYLPALSPLHLLAERGGINADRARLQIAQVQLKVLKTPAEAEKTLAKISHSAKPPAANNDPKVAELWAQRETLMKNKEKLLQQCRAVQA